MGAGVKIVVAATMILAATAYWANQPAATHPLAEPGGGGPGAQREEKASATARAEQPTEDSGKQLPSSLANPGAHGVVLGVRDSTGAPLVASCGTCHATRTPNRAIRDGGQLEEFHQGLKMRHGKLACVACHDPDDYDRLRLADGSAIAFTETKMLCGQCHSAQLRDYARGAHGGMRGYWDRSRGPQTKNDCIDCHDPHAPQFPRMKPTFKPRDRFLQPAGDTERKHP